MDDKNSKDWIIVIPSRIASKRLHKKPLIEICGKSLIQRTYERALEAVKSPDKVIIATDSKQIVDHCQCFNAKCYLTSAECLTGTDRVAEIAEKISASHYINLQGDEPIFPANELIRFIDIVENSGDELLTAVKRIDNVLDYQNNSIPKMVFSQSNRLMYSSRAQIPSNKTGIFNLAYKHVCVYAYTKEHLKYFTSRNSKTKFEEEEDLEINRFLELDIDVRCVELNESGKAVDTEEDLEEVRRIIRSESNKY